jgi:predicted aspartyl protease
LANFADRAEEHAFVLISCLRQIPCLGVEALEVLGPDLDIA